MAKFSGKIGYSGFAETTPGVHVETIVEREYYGDVLRDTRQWNNSQNLNDNLVISHRISIVADDFAKENFSGMRYVVWGGVRWKVTSIDTQYPRLTLSLGGVYNGPTA